MSRIPRSLQALISDDADGVFRFAPGSFAQSIAVAGAQVTMIPTRKARDKTAFLDASAQALQFPSYFGQNWDAFYDCVADLGERSAATAVLVFDDLSGFARTEPDEFDAALGTLTDAAAFWRERGRRLIVLVGLGEPLLAPQLPEVSFR